jgi:hypothetical protein
MKLIKILILSIISCIVISSCVTREKVVYRYPVQNDSTSVSTNDSSYDLYTDPSTNTQVVYVYYNGYGFFMEYGLWYDIYYPYGFIGCYSYYWGNRAFFDARFGYYYHHAYTIRGGSRFYPYSRYENRSHRNYTSSSHSVNTTRYSRSTRSSGTYRGGYRGGFHGRH